MYLNSGLEGEEAVYVTSEDGFYKLRGYSIYYERNQMMQDYMILRKDARRVESGTGETVIRDFRQRMEDNRVQAVSRRGAIRVLGSLCSALSIVVLAGAVVMFNNYEKMKEMESVIASALPAVRQGSREGVSGEEELRKPEDRFIPRQPRKPCRVLIPGNPGKRGQWTVDRPGRRLPWRRTCLPPGRKPRELPGLCRSSSGQKPSRRREQRRPQPYRRLPPRNISYTRFRTERLCTVSV